MLRVGIIGMGDIYHIHRACIEKIDSVELVALCDTDETKKSMAKGVNFYTDVKTMLEEANLDCLHVCLPHYLHVPITKLAASYGVNVFLEKPVSLNYQEGLELLDISNVKVGVCLQNRYNPTTIKLKEIVDSEQYGKILGMKGLVSWYRPESYYTDKPWRKSLELAGGGVMNNQSIHTLDLLYYLAKDIDKIKGRIDNLLHEDYEIEDTALAQITFKSGLRGLYFATIAYSGNSSVEVQVLLENAKLTIKDYSLTISENNSNKEIVIKDDIFSGTKSYYGASHYTAINEFYDAIVNDTTNYIKVEEALISVKMIDKIRESSNLSKTVNFD